jgi:hypothetical protein
MPYSPTENSLPTDKLNALLACDNARIITKQGGGNSVVFCIEANGQKWAVKSYPPYATNQRDRLAAELSVYQFLNHHHVPSVPFVKTFCDTERWLVMDWIDGSIPQEYAASDIEQAILFLQSINGLNHLPAAQQLPLAAEPCLSLNVLLNQIQQRFNRLEAHTEQEPELKTFLWQEYMPTLQQYTDYAKNLYRSAGIDAEAELAPEKRSLIPADFGFHNTIRDAAGKLTFFDFDYFGWDDPVKLLSDILWHPKMRLTDEQRNQFIHGIAAIYADDTSFMPRFAANFPLFGLRWVLILLNEFVPAYWQNRQHANVYQDQAKAKKIQLNRAKELLLNVQKIGCPYESTATTSV